MVDGRRFVEEKYLPIFQNGHRLNTVKCTVRRCREFIAEWGDWRIKDVSTEMIERWENKKLQTCKPSSVYRYLQMLYNLFQKALEWEYIDRSPMHKVDFPKFNNARVRFLTDQEEKVLLAALTDRYRKVVLLSINTGLREAEVCYLRWKDVDFRRGEITVIAERAKNKQERKIPMNAKARAILNELRSDQNLPEARIFGRLNPAWLRLVFSRAVKTAGLRDLRFHDTRHTFASRLVMAGVDIRTVQELMGHNTIIMTLRYSHLADEHKRSAVERLDTALDEAEEGK